MMVVAMRNRCGWILFLG